MLSRFKRGNLEIGLSRKSVFVVADGGARLCQVDGDDVESRWRVVGVLVQVGCGDFDNLRLLGRRHPCFWLPKLRGGRGFDFDEDQSVIFFCDEVDFAAQGAKSTGENAIAILFYKFFCQLFAFGTGLLQAVALFAIKRA